MTDSQLRYQTLNEERRHNFAMETYAKEQAAAATSQAEAASTRAEVEKGKALYDILVEKPFRRRLDSQRQVHELKQGYMRAGATMLGVFTGGLSSVGALFA